MFGHDRLRRAAVLAGLLLLASLGTGTAAPAAPPPATGAGARQLRTVPLADLGRGGYLRDVNASGQVLGALIDANDETQPVLWRTYDEPVVLGIPGGAEQTLNNRGHVAGARAAAGGWLWRPNGVTYLGGSRSVWVTDLNDHDQVAGEFEPTGSEPSSAFLWHDGRFREIGAPAGMGSYAMKVNNRGDVLGYQVDQDWTVMRGFIWRHGTTTILNGPQGAAIQPIDFNDRGQVIGVSAVAGSEVGHPVLWQDGRVTDLAGSGSAGDFWASDINNRGDVVGRVDGQAVMWRNGRPTRIGVNGAADRINDRGDIAGTSITSTPDDTLTIRAFRWRAGHVLYSTPVTGHEVSLGVVGLDELGRIVGRTSDDQGNSDIVAWVAD